MPKDDNRQIRYQPAESNPALKQLDALVGEWKMEIHVPTDPPTVISDLWTTFEWMEGGTFLVWQWGPARPDFPGGLFPAAHSLIGYDESSEKYLMHYFDSRGVARLLEMSLEDETWKIWRFSPGFSQRFKGTVRDNVMTGFWEKSSDGMSWELDFEMVFTKEI
jgi:hypothetical protein